MSSAAPGPDGRLHVGLTPWLDAALGSADTLARQAELAEELGYQSFWLPESHFSGPSSNPTPLLKLAAVAARTRRLLLGTTSYLLPVRHPIHVAEEVAVLDQLSGGRVILGVGRGFRRALFSAFEIPVKEKRDRFEAALEVMLSAWRGEPVAWEAPPKRAAGAGAGAVSGGSDGNQGAPVTIAPLPVQQPHPPIWVAAFGPKALSQAGRLGLPYLASPIETLPALEDKYAQHAAAFSAAAHSHEDSLAVPVMRTVFASRDAGAVARVREGLSAQARAMATGNMSALRDAAGSALDDWALVGEPGFVADRVGSYREKLGVTHLILRVAVPGASAEEMEASLRLVAEIDW